MSDELETGPEIDTGIVPAPDTAPETAAPVAPSRPTIDDAINAAFAAQENGQPRDEAGRFAAKVAAEAAAANAAAVTPPATASAAPASWPKDKAGLYSSASPELQAYIAQREEQISAGFAQYEGLAGYADLARQNGNTLRTVLDNVHELENGMAADPVGTLAMIVHRYGIDPNQLAAVLTGQAQHTPPPRQAPPIDIERIVSQQIAQRDIQREVAAFSADANNKHFETVAPNIAALLQSNPALSLQDAYDRACWADPTIRADLQRDAALKAATEQANTTRATTQSAQRAMKSLVPSSAQPLNGARKMSIDESIEDAWTRHAG